MNITVKILIIISLFFNSACTHDGVLNLDPVTFFKGLNPKKIYDINKKAKKEAESKNADNKNEDYHEIAAKEYGKYVGDPGYAGLFKFFGEIFQFVYYTGDDIVRRIVPGGEKKGKYQPYLLDKEKGGLKDSARDIRNAEEGAEKEFAKKKRKALDYSHNYEPEKTALKSLIVIGVLVLLFGSF